MEVKKCIKCGVSKPIQDFNMMSNGKIKPAKVCIVCRFHGIAKPKNKKVMILKKEKPKNMMAADRKMSRLIVKDMVKNGEVEKGACIHTGCKLDGRMPYHKNPDKVLVFDWYCDLHHPSRRAK